MNKWELFELATEVLTDVELMRNEEFHHETLTIQTLPDWASITGETVLSIHLTNKGFDMFMEHVRVRSEQIGEEVREPINNAMETTKSMTRVSWLGVPGLEFFCIKDVPASDEKEGET